MLRRHKEIATLSYSYNSFRMTSGDKQRRPEDHSSLPCGLACGYRSNGKYEHKNLLLDMRQKLFVVIFFSFLLETSTFVEGFLSSAYQKFTKQVATLHMKERYYHEPDESDDRFSSNDEDLFHDLMACRSHSEDIGNSTKFNHVRGPASLLSPESVIPAIMNALKRNDEPHKDAGLTMVWEFTTETTKYVFKNNVTGENSHFHHFFHQKILLSSMENENN